MRVFIQNLLLMSMLYHSPPAFGRVGSPLARREPHKSLVAASSTLSVGDMTAINTALVLVGYGAYSAYQRCPRGRLEITPHALVVAPSNVPNAGLGLFAGEDLPAGTRLGTYPGILYASAGDWLQTKEDVAVPAAKSYVWTLANGKLIDPTDDAGNLPEELSLLQLGLFGVDTRLARINEPTAASGGDVNVVADEHGDEVVFVVDSRTILRGSELYMDYGKVYSRESYNNQ